MKQLLLKRSPARVSVEALQRRKRILLGHLNSNGDCLYATAIARQIKVDYPGCHLTWAIGSMCRSILDGNPYVDEVWEIPLENIREVPDVWQRFVREAGERKRGGDFDEIFLTQIVADNLQVYDGTIRSSIFRAYPRKITGPVLPVLRLSSIEVENVCRFAQHHRLAARSNVVLFECSVKSGQSFITPEYALEVAQDLIARVPSVSVILSSNIPIVSTDERIIDGSILSLRENAELTKYCCLLIGGSSGISWICTSDWAKPLPMIQLLKRDAFWFASFAYDYEYWGLPTDSIVEMTEYSSTKISECVLTIFTEGVKAARMKFNEKVLPTFDSYEYFLDYFLGERQYRKATSLLLCHIQRHRFHFQFIHWYLTKLISHVHGLVANMSIKIVKRVLRRYLPWVYQSLKWVKRIRSAGQLKSNGQN